MSRAAGRRPPRAGRRAPDAGDRDPAARRVGRPDVPAGGAGAPGPVVGAGADPGQPAPLHAHLPHRRRERAGRGRPGLEQRGNLAGAHRRPGRCRGDPGRRDRDRRHPHTSRPPRAVGAAAGGIRCLARDAPGGTRLDAGQALARQRGPRGRPGLAGLLRGAAGGGSRTDRTGNGHGRLSGHARAGHPAGRRRPGAAAGPAAAGGVDPRAHPRAPVPARGNRGPAPHRRPRAAPDHPERGPAVAQHRPAARRLPELAAPPRRLPGRRGAARARVPLPRPGRPDPHPARPPRPAVRGGAGHPGPARPGHRLAGDPGTVLVPWLGGGDRVHAPGRPGGSRRPPASPGRSRPRPGRRPPARRAGPLLARGWRREPVIPTAGGRC